MRDYLIWREGDGPDPIGDANRNNEYWASVFGPDDALHDYLICCDMNSYFVDGYPEGEVYCVLDTKTGLVYKYGVETEFEPNFLLGAVK